MEVKANRGQRGSFPENSPRGRSKTSAQTITSTVIWA
jgi:hypothetical protein